MKANRIGRNQWSDKKRRQPILLDKYAMLPLSNGSLALLDKEDAIRLSKYNWSVNGRGYITRGFHKDGKLMAVYMSREILKYKGKLFIDHINHNKLDNRKSNLRLATNSQNCRNSKKHIDGHSKYKGVSNCRRRWLSRVRVNYTLIHLGSYADEVNAAIAYDKAARKYHGEFAKTNFKSE